MIGYDKALFFIKKGWSKGHHFETHDFIKDIITWAGEHFETVVC